MNDPSRGQIDPQKDFQELNHPSVRSMYRANVKVVVEHLHEKDRQRVNAADPDHRPRDRVLQQVEECEKHQLAPESILRWRVRVEAKRGTSIEQSQQDLAMESAFVSFEYRDSPRCEQIFRVPHSRASCAQKKQRFEKLHADLEKEEACSGLEKFSEARRRQLPK